MVVMVRMVRGKIYDILLVINTSHCYKDLIFSIDNLDVASSSDEEIHAREARKRR